MVQLIIPDIVRHWLQQHWFNAAHFLLSASLALSAPKYNLLKMSSGYISMSNFKPFLPYILKKITRSHKFDQFHQVRMMPKCGKSTDSDQNLISSEGDQDTWAYQSSGHSSLALSRKCLEVTNLTCFTMSKCCQNGENQQKMTKI